MQPYMEPYKTFAEKLKKLLFQILKGVVVDEEHDGAAGTEAHDLGHEAAVERRHAFLALDGCHGGETSPVLDLPRDGLRPLDATLSNVERNVRDRAQRSGGQTDEKLPAKLLHGVLQNGESVLDVVIEAKVDHVENSVSTESGGEAFVDPLESESVGFDDLSGGGIGASLLLQFHARFSLETDFHHLKRVDDESFGEPAAEAGQGESQRVRLRFAEGEEDFVLFEGEELDGPFGRLGEKRRQNAFVERRHALGANHLPETVEDGRVTHVHRVGALDLKPGFDEIQRMHQRDFNEPGATTRRKLAEPLAH